MYLAVGQFRAALNESPLELYNSLPTFLPPCTFSSRLLAHSRAIPRLIFPSAGKHKSATHSLHNGRKPRARSATFLPLGTMPPVPTLASAEHQDGGTVQMWHVSSGPAKPQGHTRVVSSVAFSPDGLCIASGSFDCIVHIWDAQHGTSLATLRGHKGAVRALAFSPDSMRVASGSDDGTVRVWNVHTATVQATLRERSWHATIFTSLCFSPDGKHVLIRRWADDISVLDIYEVLPTGYQALKCLDPPTVTMLFDKFMVRNGWLFVQHTPNSTPRRICWVPPHLRPVTSNALSWHNYMVVLGSATGAVTLLDCTRVLSANLYQSPIASAWLSI